MNAEDIRRKNLNYVLLHYFSDDRLACALSMGYEDVNYFNQLINPKGHVSFGTATANKVTRAIEKPKGWLDVPQWPSVEEKEDSKQHKPAVLTPIQQAALDKLKSLNKDSQAQALNYINYLSYLEGSRSKSSKGSLDKRKA